MIPFQLSPASEADAVTIHRLIARCAPWCLPVRLEDLRARVGDFLTVRSESGEVVACAALRDLGGRRFELGSVAVSPDHRGVGLGRRLVESVVRLSSPGARQLVCVTRCPAFFARLGFEPLSADALLQRPGVPDVDGFPPRVAMALPEGERSRMGRAA